jgi:exosortase
MSADEIISITGRRAAPKVETPPEAKVHPQDEESNEYVAQREAIEPGDTKLRLMLGCVLLVVGVWAYGSTIQEMATQWDREPDYSHGYLVPPAAFLFLWLRRDSFPGVGASDWLIGIPLVLFSIAMRLAAAAFFLEAVDGWSILPWLAGSVAILFGRAVLLWSLSSIAFLFFMVPLPYSLAGSLSLPLQSLATKLSCWTLQCLGQPVIAQGNVLVMGHHHLEVAQACSGLRIFMSIVAMGFVYLIFISKQWWLRILILASVLPVAVAANVLRIVTTAFLYEYAAKGIGDKFSHDLAGWMMIPVAAGMFWLVLRYFELLFPDTELEHIPRGFRT